MLKFLRRYYIIILLAVFIIILHYLSWLQPVENVWQKVIITLSAPVHTLSSSIQSWSGWQDKTVLQKKVNELEKQLRDSQRLRAQISLLEKENNSLKKALSWQEQSERRYRISKIIGHPLNLPNTYFIINQGQKDGVVEGLSVVIEEDILIGKIVKTDSHTSFVQLLLDNQSLVSVTLEGRQEPIGVVKGELGLSLNLELVPHDITLMSGDIVITSGLDSLIPQGLIVGSIGKIIKQTDDFFQSASIETAYDVARLNIVSVILNE